ncbi:MAG: hypothetical protein ACLS3C_11735 [Oscillospiraceae bacterium]
MRQTDRGHRRRLARTAAIRRPQSCRTPCSRAGRSPGVTVFESVIGLGGFGITYCAYDQKLACTAALKEYFSGVANRIPGSKEVILYAGKRTEEFRQGYTRFLNEARNMIQFQSVPNVVQVREYFEENGTAYIVMEYLRGHTLKTEIERAPLDVGARGHHRRGHLRRADGAAPEGDRPPGRQPGQHLPVRRRQIGLIDLGAARVSMQQTPLTVVFKDCFTLAGAVFLARASGAADGYLRAGRHALYRDARQEARKRAQPLADGPSQGPAYTEA